MTYEQVAAAAKEWLPAVQTSRLPVYITPDGGPLQGPFLVRSLPWRLLPIDDRVAWALIRQQGASVGLRFCTYSPTMSRETIAGYCSQFQL